jgi:hypothetical protein
MEPYLEIVLKRLNPFAVLTGFDRGGLAEPFIPFWLDSTGRPLLSAAIFYSMQPSGELIPASRVALDLPLTRKCGEVLGSFAERSFGSNVNADRI